MISPEQAVLNSMLVCAGGALVTLGIGRNRALAGWLAFLTVALSSVLAWSAVIQVWRSGPGEPTTFVTYAQYGFALRLSVDGLSAVFLALIATIALPATFYSIDYLKHHADYSPRGYYPHLLLFIAAMYGIVSTTDTMYFFFIFWQMMTLTSFALVRYESRKPENLRAANKYLLLMQIACVLTMLGALLLAPAGAVAGPNGPVMRFDFDALSQHLPKLLVDQRGVVVAAFAMFLAGFGIKLGMWPLGQIWLPDAHPAAPSPVSALLSGVMIKTGIYGLMRYFLWLVPGQSIPDFPAETWGLVIASLGTITLLTGTVQALKQDQGKRLLAFSSIGQAGYILLGLGACLALLPSNDPKLRLLAAAGFYGALFHTLNHGVFKSLLFLNAGSVLYATGTQDLNQLGGLMRFMPRTAVCSLVASLSISGVPLFSGFASKWCLYVAAIQGGSHARYLPVFAVVGILTSALTLATYMKFHGAVFLSRSSAWVQQKAGLRGSLEVPRSMQLAQFGLAAGCVLAGLLPFAVVQAMQSILQRGWQGFSVRLDGLTPFGGGLGAGLEAMEHRAVLAPLLLALMLGLVFLMVLGFSRLGAARRRTDAPWLCGYMRATELTRYPARSFYGELKRYLVWMGGTPPAAPGVPLTGTAATSAPPAPTNPAQGPESHV